MKDMKLGLQLGYWGSGPPDNATELVSEAERLGFLGVMAGPLVRSSYRAAEFFLRGLMERERTADAHP